MLSCWLEHHPDTPKLWRLPECPAHRDHGRGRAPPLSVSRLPPLPRWPGALPGAWSVRANTLGPAQPPRKAAAPPRPARVRGTCPRRSRRSQLPRLRRGRPPRPAALGPLPGGRPPDSCAGREGCGAAGRRRRLESEAPGGTPRTTAAGRTGWPCARGGARGRSEPALGCPGRAAAPLRRRPPARGQLCRTQPCLRRREASESGRRPARSHPRLCPPRSGCSLRPSARAPQRRPRETERYKHLAFIQGPWCVPPSLPPQHWRPGSALFQESHRHSQGGS